jgi:hypothetical protein
MYKNTDDIDNDYAYLLNELYTGEYFNVNK